VRSTKFRENEMKERRYSTRVRTRQSAVRDGLPGLIPTTAFVIGTKLGLPLWIAQEEDRAQLIF